MPQFGLFTCYAGLLAGVAASSFSGAVPIRFVTASPHQRSLDTKLSSFAQESNPPTAEDKTDGKLGLMANDTRASLGYDVSCRRC